MASYRPGMLRAVSKSTKGLIRKAFHRSDYHITYNNVNLINSLKNGRQQLNMLRFENENQFFAIAAFLRNLYGCLLVELLHQRVGCF